MRKKRTALEDAMYVNNATYVDYLERFKKIAMSIFEWENLPDSMDARYLEKCLYYTGCAALLYLEPYGFINTKATSGSQLNLYGLPTDIHCYSYGVINERRRAYNGLAAPDPNKDKEAILVMNSWEMIPTANTIELFALRLYEAERSCDINIKAQKTPYIVMTNDSQRHSMVNAYNQVDQHAAVIFGEKDHFDPNNIKALSTTAPFVADKIMDYKKEIWNEALTFLGVNNLSEKRERLISSETNTNNELINLNLMSYLKPRELAAKQFNEKFGLTGTDKEIKVKVRSDLDNIIKRAASVVTEQYADQIIDEAVMSTTGVTPEDK